MAWCIGVIPVEHEAERLMFHPACLWRFSVFVPGVWDFSSHRYHPFLLHYLQSIIWQLWSNEPSSIDSYCVHIHVAYGLLVG
jgi:hypothetical protein